MPTSSRSLTGKKASEENQKHVLSTCITSCYAGGIGGLNRDIGKK